MRQSLAVSALCIALAAALPGCGSVPSDLTERFSRSQLEDTVGKPYAQVIKGRHDFGKPIGIEGVPSGRQIYKHIADFGEESSTTFGRYAEEKRQVRIVYFLVDAEGTVKDWATKIHRVGKSRCWNGYCVDGFKPPPTEELDQVVKTSRDETLAAWRAGS